MKAFIQDSDSVKGPYPSRNGAEVEAAREEMIEAASVSDDELMMKYLEGETLTDKEIEHAVGLGTKTGYGAHFGWQCPIHFRDLSAHGSHYSKHAFSGRSHHFRHHANGEEVTISTSDEILALVYKPWLTPMWVADAV